MASVRVRLIAVAAVMLLVAAACGGGEANDEPDGTLVTIGSEDGGDTTDGDDGGDTTDGGDGGDTASSSGGDGGDGSGEDADGDGFPDDDAPEIVGNPDLDMDELEEVAPDAADALDEIDDIVSIDECASETVGLRMTYVPENWKCRGLDGAGVGGLDGFTLFMDNNVGGIEITIGTPSPFGSPCELMQVCDQAEPIDLGSNFDMQQADMLGIPLIFGTHTTVDAEVSVVTLEALDEDDIAFITMVLDGVEEY